MQSLAAQVLAWVDRHGLGSEPATAATLAAARPWDVAALLFPGAPMAAVVVVGQWLAVNFIVDDLLDELTDPRECATRATALLAALDTSDAPDAIDPTDLGLEGAVADLWGRTTAGRSADWCAALRTDVADWLLSYEQEATDRAECRVPGLAEYLEHRRASSGMAVFTGLAELATGVDLVAATRSAAPLPALRATTAIAMGVLNDLRSADKERAAGQVHNAVCVVMAHAGVGLDAAQQVAEGVVGTLGSRFDLLAGQVAEPDAARCVAAYRAMIDGARAVCAQLGRYASPVGVGDRR